MAMLELDHLTILAPSLTLGVDHVRACLDLDIPYGGAHPEMGTHNHLLRLSDATFLEVIAIDPAAKPPARPRWFGLDDADAVRSAWEDGRRLRGWVARTRHLTQFLPGMATCWVNRCGCRVAIGPGCSPCGRTARSPQAALRPR
jgi:hypothetical protein